MAFRQQRRRNVTAVCGLLCLAALAALQVFGFIGQEVAREGRVKQPAPHEKSDAGAADGAQRALAARDMQKSAVAGERRTGVPAAGEAKEAKEAEAGAAFVMPGLAAPARVRGGRTRRGAAAEEATAPLELPEANYATMRAAEDCIAEGCPIDTIEEIAGKLARDESRLQELFQHASSEGAQESDEGSWLDGILLSVHQMREHLEDVVTQRRAGYIPFGSGQTGGYFRVPAH